MSSATTPIAAAFEMQRRSIQFGERLIEQGLTVQRDATESAIRNGFAAQREAQQQAMELARRLFHAQVDAVQTTLSSDEFRSIVDRQFEAIDEDQTVAMDEFESTLVDAFDEMSERQREVFVESVESALDAHADVERQAVQGVGRSQDVARTAQQQAETVADVAQQGTEQMAAQTTEAAEQGLNTAQRGVATAQQTAGGAATETTQQTPQSSELQSEAAQLEEIEGLGPTYADRLQGEGIESMTDLADADADRIAEIAEVAQDQAEEWVEEATSWT